MPEIMTMNEVCEYLRISRQKGYRLVWEQAFPSIKIGKCRRVKREDLIIYLDRQSRPGLVVSS